MCQADQTLADNIKEFGLELLGWYDLQRVFGEYDPVTGERLSFGDRLFAGGMLLLSVIPPAKGAGIAGKAGIRGAKAAGTAADVSKLISKTKNVLNYDKIKLFFQTIYHQVIKGPITETIRSFKKQWENFLENVGSVLQGPQPALAGIGPARGVWMSRAEREVKETTMNMIGKTEDEVVGKGTGKGLLPGEGKVGTYKQLIKQGKAFDNLTPHHMPSAEKIKKAGIKRNDGVSMNMEQPHPGTGGRHRRTYTYGLSGEKLNDYLNLSYRDALAHDIWDARRIYMKGGLYTPEIRKSLRDVIQLNKELYPELFKK
jgi:hypothetical protein